MLGLAVFQTMIPISAVSGICLPKIPITEVQLEVIQTRKIVHLYSK